MQTPSERINEVLKAHGLNVKTLSERLHYARPQGLYDVATGRTKSISKDLANRIVTAFPEFSRTWLLTGEGPMTQPNPSKPQPLDDEPLILTGAAKVLVMNLSATLSQQEANIAKLAAMVDRLTGAAADPQKVNAG